LHQAKDRIYPHRLFTPIALLSLSLLILIAYSNAFWGSFHLDDFVEIVRNERIKDIGDIFEVLKGRRGVAMATFALNYAIGGLDVFGYHAVNTAIHIISSILAYLLLFKTLRLAGLEEGGGRRVSAVVAFMFALHPIQTESVTYIIQRMEGLMGLFFLLGILLFVKGSESRSPLRQTLWYSGVMASYGLGFYSKEIAVTMPVAIAMYDVFFISRFSLSGLLKRWPVYVLLSVLTVFFIKGAFFPAGLTAIEGASGAFEEVGEASAGFGMKSISPMEYGLTQLNALVYYISLLFYPANQNIDHDFPVALDLFSAPDIRQGNIFNLPSLPPVFSLAILLLIASLAVYLMARHRGQGRVASFFILFFFLVMTPTSSVMPIADVLSEHRLYLASLGVFAASGVALDAGLKRLFKDRCPAASFVLLVALAVALSGLTYRRNMVYKDEISLWTDVLNKTSGKARAYNNLASAYMDKGEYGPAIPLLKAGIAIDGGYEEMHFNLGLSYLNTSRFEPAKEEFRKAVDIGEFLLKGSKVNPPRMLTPARINLANTSFITGDYKEAIALYQEVLRQGVPNPESLRFNLALSYKRAGMYKEALAELKALLEANPEDREAMAEYAEVRASLSQR
jgi:tetratricopeptide (TPR) repeat protein